MRILFFLFFLLTLGCTHAPIQTPTGGGLYPFGAYSHRVKIQVLTNEPRTMEMRGAVSVSAEKVRVVGLSLFGTTVFHIQEDLKTGAIQKEFYLEILRKNSEQFMKFYQLIRELITAPKSATEFDRGAAHFSVRD